MILKNKLNVEQKIESKEKININNQKLKQL